MKIEPLLSDEAILREMGKRLKEVRLGSNLTQEALAESSGVSTRTVGRLELGEVGVQLSSLVRVCRTLGLIGRLEMLIPEATPSPIALLKLKSQQRHRASGKRIVKPAPTWKWGDEPKPEKI